MNLKSILTSSVTLGLLMSSFAAQAGTRPQTLAVPIRPAAAESAFSNAGARKTLTVRRENGIQTVGVALIGVAGAGLGAAVYTAVDGKSRGAN